MARVCHLLDGARPQCSPWRGDPRCPARPFVALERG